MLNVQLYEHGVVTVADALANQGVSAGTVGAPHGPLHAGHSTRTTPRDGWAIHRGSQILFVADVRSILMVLWHFKGTAFAFIVVGPATNTSLLMLIASLAGQQTQHTGGQQQQQHRGDSGNRSIFSNITRVPKVVAVIATFGLSLSYVVACSTRAAPQETLHVGCSTRAAPCGPLHAGLLHAGRSTGVAPQDTLHTSRSTEGRSTEGRSTEGAPRVPHHEGRSRSTRGSRFFYKNTDVRSILMVLWRISKVPDPHGVAARRAVEHSN